jgi:hypothetical protein
MSPRAILYRCDCDYETINSANAKKHKRHCKKSGVFDKVPITYRIPDKLDRRKLKNGVFEMVEKSDRSMVVWMCPECQSASPLKTNTKTHIKNCRYVEDLETIEPLGVRVKMIFLSDLEPVEEDKESEESLPTEDAQESIHTESEIISIGDYSEDIESIKESGTESSDSESAESEAPRASTKRKRSALDVRHGLKDLQDHLLADIQKKVDMLASVRDMLQ